MLLAQSGFTTTSQAWVAILSVAVVMLFVGVVSLVMLVRHVRSSRQLLHAERMRSLEAGFPLEAPEEAKLQSKFLHNAFWISFWMVFTVPTAALSAASASTQANATLALSIVIWIVAGAVGIAAVVCAAVLMIYSRGRKSDDGDGLRKMPKM
jgi:NADH:ubiquinone oxidoreductase subunit 3 (subunit A)